MKEVPRLSVLLLLLLAPSFLSAAPKKKARRKTATKISAKAFGPVSTVRDVSVIDVLTGSMEANQDILMRDGTIVAVRKTTTPGKITRYAIPGLWDMHVHLWHNQNQFPLYIANGVTGVRNMGADLPRIRRWQAAIAKGEINGPRIYTSGSVIVSEPGPADPKLPVVVVQSPADARKAFNTFYDQEVNFIKVIDMSEGAFEALAEASRHDGVPFAGHLPDSVSAFTAAQDRMSSMEHLFGVALACSSKDEELRNKRILARGKKDWATAARLARETIDTYDPPTAKKLFDDFRRFNVRQTPTLTFWSRANFEGAAAWPTAADLRLVSDSIRKQWKQPEEDLSALTPADKLLLQLQYDFAMRVTGEMARAGVPLLAGTDTGDPWTAPGFELHKELALLVKAGLTPVQALRSATTEPAALMRRPTELGQIRKGFVADIVILNANPLVEIQNTRRIHTVVLRGKQFDQTQLKQMLAKEK